VITTVERGDLGRRWAEIARRAKWTGDTGGELAILTTAYDGAARHYHNLRHILQCLEALERVMNFRPNSPVEPA
jgi:predicted metal-dependent HD superfamily phosphohydrolase